METDGGKEVNWAGGGRKQAAFMQEANLNIMQLQTKRHHIFTKYSKLGRRKK